MWSVQLMTNHLAQRAEERRKEKKDVIKGIIDIIESLRGIVAVISNKQKILEERIISLERKHQK